MSSYYLVILLLLIVFTLYLFKVTVAKSLYGHDVVSNLMLVGLSLWDRVELYVGKRKRNLWDCGCVYQLTN